MEFQIHFICHMDKTWLKKLLLTNCPPFLEFVEREYMKTHVNMHIKGKEVIPKVKPSYFCLGNEVIWKL